MKQFSIPSELVHCSHCSNDLNEILLMGEYRVAVSSWTLEVYDTSDPDASVAMNFTLQSTDTDAPSGYYQNHDLSCGRCGRTLDASMSRHHCGKMRFLDVEREI